MYFIKTLTFTVVILCISKYITAQNYEADIYDDYSSEGEAKGDSSETSGFVTPLDFSPLFGGPGFGISGVASTPTKKYHSLFNVGGGSVSGQDFFEGQSSDKQFSPESFGFVPQFSQGLAAETISLPKRYQGKTLQIERTTATATSSDITRSPLQFNIETSHNAPYKKLNKPEHSAALKSADYKSAVTKLSDDHLSPYKKYSFQQQGTFVPPPTYQTLGATDSGFSTFDTHNLRYKRYSNKRKPKSQAIKAKQNEETAEDDGESAYDYRSDYNSRPKEFDESDAYDVPDYYFGGNSEKKKYDYGDDEEYGLDEYERIKSLSQQQAAELKKHPENCKQVQKGSMTCSVCSNPKTGGSYESCAYASEPKNNKYAYVKEQKFDSKDQPEDEEESKEISNTEKPVKTQNLKVVAPPPTTNKPKEESFENYSSYKYKSPQANPTYKPPKAANLQTKNQYVNNRPKSARLTKKPSSDYRDYYTAPASPKAESSAPERYAAYTQDYDNDNDNEEEEEEQPEQNSNNSEEDEEEISPIPGFFSDNEEKKDVESVLAEFTKKDRSACKKVYKNHMTCYQCTDKKGMKHEECMFVSESAPKSSHLAYKEVKEFNSKPEALQNANGAEGAESKIVTAKPLAELILSTTESTLDILSKINKNQPIKKYSELKEFPKITPTTFLSSTFTTPLDKISTQFHPSSTAYTKLDYTSPKIIIKRKARSAEKQQVKSNDFEKYDEPPSDLSNLDRIADPDDFSGAESKGAFWEETVPKYNEKLGVALPRYMLEKSEAEAEFEKTLAANSK